MPEVYDYNIQPGDDYAVPIDYKVRRTKQRMDTMWRRAAIGGFLIGALVMFVIYRAVELTYA